MHGQPPGRRGAVDSLAQGLQADLSAGELIDKIEDLPNITSETVEPQDNHGISGAGEGEKLGKLRPIRARAGGSLDEDAFAPCPLQRVDL